MCRIEVILFSGNLQQVVNRSDVRENVRADARMKYRSCVERSRALHSKVQMYRQDSVTSTLSNVSDDRNMWVLPDILKTLT